MSRKRGKLTPWPNTRVAHLLSVCRAVATVVDDKTMERANPNGYDKEIWRL